jgi:hypothetical protein
MTDKMTVKACKTSKQIMVQLLQTGTDEKPSPKTVSQVLLIFYNSINDKTILIWNYAVKVRRRELRAGGNKLSAARGLRRIIWVILKSATFLDTRVSNERRTILPTKKEWYKRSGLYDEHPKPLRAELAPPSPTNRLPTKT